MVFKYLKAADLKSIKLIYVGRIRIEKGIFSLLKIMNKTKQNITLSIVGLEQFSEKRPEQNNINYYKMKPEEKLIILR